MIPGEAKNGRKTLGRGRSKVGSVHEYSCGGNIIDRYGRDRQSFAVAFDPSQRVLHGAEAETHQAGLVQARPLPPQQRKSRRGMRPGATFQKLTKPRSENGAEMPFLFGSPRHTQRLHTQACCFNEVHGLLMRLDHGLRSKAKRVLRRCLSPRYKQSFIGLPWIKPVAILH